MRFPQFDLMHKFNEKHNGLQKMKERLFRMNTTALIKRRTEYFRLLSTLPDDSSRAVTGKKVSLFQTLMIHFSTYLRPFSPLTRSQRKQSFELLRAICSCPDKNI